MGKQIQIKHTHRVAELLTIHFTDGSSETGKIEVLGMVKMHTVVSGEKHTRMMQQYSINGRDFIVWDVLRIDVLVRGEPRHLNYPERRRITTPGRTECQKHRDVASCEECIRCAYCKGQAAHPFPEKAIDLFLNTKGI